MSEWKFVLISDSFLQRVFCLHPHRVLAHCCPSLSLILLDVSSP